MTTKSSPVRQEGKSLAISRAMSAPTIELEDGRCKISGSGLALCGCSIEQDAAYWEWHILSIPEKSSDETMFGVATRKNSAFYKSLDEQSGDESPQTNGKALMQKVPIQEGDTVGVAVQQSDLPMIQFLKNGEPLHHLCINRFRGSVYPSIFLPHGENLQIQLVLDENEFKQMSPHARFGPVIVARGII
eukprot:CAMPEP_0202493182 /NCGR_PEP_ID=MMETSP1361-20130828/9612_1 /ASSEMBLY_ACC=CAM_ASM_000849 /TAXON_ID=210615 /ORGANISM="Staurosira complex sp., Strain CCMP2646" /LENGTH=188 /DNA_ID=CAMNT_0049123465 /DNA_START=149 /DNA_END=715 /DNA_ORIENTATION=-